MLGDATALMNLKGHEKQLFTCGFAWWAREDLNLRSGLPPVPPPGALCQALPRDVAFLLASLC